MTDLTPQEQKFLLYMKPERDYWSGLGPPTFTSLHEKGLVSKKETYLMGHRMLYTLTPAGEEARDTLLTENARREALRKD